MQRYENNSNMNLLYENQNIPKELESYIKNNTTLHRYFESPNSLHRTNKVFSFVFSFMFLYKKQYEK